MAILTINPKRVRPLLGSITSMIELGEASQVGRTVYVAADGKAYETDGADADKVSGQVGLIVAGSRAVSDGALIAGERVTALWFGRVALAGASLDETAQYYLADETGGESGLIGDAAGTVTRRIGAPEAAEIFFFNPNTVAPTS